MSRFQFVEDHRGAFGVERLCRVLECSRSGFYRWPAGTTARVARRRADVRLAERIRVIHVASGGTYGSPGITAELADDGLAVNHKRVEPVMRAAGIVGVHLRRKVRITIPEPSATPVPDLLQRDFTAATPNTRYVGDITYLPVGDSQFLYLATVLDLCSKRLVGCSIATHMPTELVTDALKAAAEIRGGRLDGAVFHSDNGAQGGFNWSSRGTSRKSARSWAWSAPAARWGPARTMPPRNRSTRAWRETLQGRKSWSGAREARHAVFRWVTRYNTRRRHSSIGQISPIAYEQRSIRCAR